MVEKFNISLSKETKEKGIQDSKIVLGKKNLSGYISYLINKAKINRN